MYIGIQFLMFGKNSNYARYIEKHRKHQIDSNVICVVGLHKIFIASDFQL